MNEDLKINVICEIIVTFAQHDSSLRTAWNET